MRKPRPVALLAKSMAIRTYRLATTSAVSGTGIATTTVVANGTIIGFAVSITGTGGAAIGHYMNEVALNQTSINNGPVSGAPSEALLGKWGFSFNITTANFLNVYQPMSRKITAGNLLCINQSLIAGTAATVCSQCIDVFVQE